MKQLPKSITGIVLAGAVVGAGLLGISAQTRNAEMSKAKQSLKSAKVASEWSTKHRKEKGIMSVPAPNAENGIASVQEFQSVVSYSDDWEYSDGEPGVYKFSSETPIHFNQLFVSEDYTPSGGAFFTDKYYFLTTMSEDWFTGEVEVYTYKYSRSGWEEVSYSAQSIYALYNAICYDPIDDLAYEFFYSDNGGAWGYMNPSNMGVTHIAEMTEQLVSVAINENGKAYGITSSGKFCRIDKKTGALTEIGDTGLSPMYMQSAAFGIDGKLYWAASEAYSSGLYTIDVNTGDTSLIGYFSGTEEVCALWAIQSQAAPDAPAAPLNLHVDVSGADLTFPFSFTMPSKTADGSALSSEIGYEVTIDGETAATGSAPAGTSVEVKLTVSTPGYHLFKVLLSNDAGKSRFETLRAWIGVDEPMPVKNVSVEKADGNKIEITWEVPEGGVNGGFFNADLLTYSITRLPENKVVAENLTETSFTDTIELGEGQCFVRYLITPVVTGLSGQSVESEGVIIGKPYEIPVEFNFDTQEDYNLFTVIDNNETVTLDSGLWQYSPSGQAAGYVGGTKDGDDWLITPSFSLKKGVQYIISHDALCYSDNWPEEYSVYLGTSPSIEGMTTQIVAPTTIWWDEYRTKTVVVTVPEDGVYYLGFHATSEAGSVFFLIDAISIHESYNLQSPAQVSALSVEAGENGDKKAYISFTTPFNNVDGKELDDDVTVRICRDGVVIKTYYDVAPDERMTYMDDEANDRAMNEYSVFCSNYYGVGPSESESVWVGLDSPSAPLHARIVLDAENHPVISWEKPEGKGVHGGYVDNSDLSYTVAYNANGELIPVANKISGFSCTDAGLTLTDTGDQEMHQFFIVPSSNATDEYGSNATALYISGMPYALPFKESFSGTRASNFWALTSTGSEGWGIGNDWQIGSQDDDDGVLYYLPAVPEVTMTAMSGKIDVEGAENPTLTFYLRKMTIADNGFFDTDPSKDVLRIKGAADSFDPQNLMDIRLADIKTAGEYIYYSVPLKDLNADKFVVVAFEYEAMSDRTPIMIDNITVKDMCEYNAVVGQVNSPEAVEAMEMLTVEAEVTNAGNNILENVSVRLMREGRIEAEEIVESLVPEQTKIVALEARAIPEWGEKAIFTVEVVAENDEIVDDDTSSEFSVDILFHARPAVTDLSYSLDEANDVLELAWTEPQGAIDLETRVTESFEGYDHGDQSFGDWRSEDKSFWGFDGVKDIVVDGVTIEIPASDDAQAFMVFDPALAGLDYDDNPEWEPVSGNKVIACFGDAANDDWEPNNDWLVSPELSGKKQTISFYARTAAKKGRPDEIRVYYTDAIEYNASGTVKTSSFTALTESSVTLTREWVKYEYELPAGAQYFAIRNLSEDGYAVLIDDITYEPLVNKTNAVLEGYNIYRDGVLLNESPVSETSFTVSPVGNGTYVVRAVYDEGESEDSNEVIIMLTGISDVEAYGAAEEYYDLRGMRVYEPQEGHIYIVNHRKIIYRRK